MQKLLSQQSSGLKPYQQYFIILVLKERLYELIYSCFWTLV